MFSACHASWRLLRKSWAQRLTLVATLAAFGGLAAPGDGAASGEQGTGSRHFAHLFTLVGDYPLGAATSRTDYQSIDPVANRLYLSKMGDGQLLVFDTAHDEFLERLDGYPKITGVLVVPELHRLYASVPGSGLVSSLRVGLGMLGLSSGAGALAIIDTGSLKEIRRLSGGVFPDGIAYDPLHHRIFVSDELGAAVFVIDAKTEQAIARIRMGGEVGNVQYDRTTAKVFAPIQTRNELASIDPVKNTLETRMQLPGCRHPHGLAIAPQGAVGYVACDANDILLTVDLASDRVLASLPVAHDPDVMATDPGLKRLYVASESGVLSTFDISNAKAPISLGDVFVADDAHAVAVDPMSHRLYFGLANVKGRSLVRVLLPRDPAAP